MVTALSIVIMITAQKATYENYKVFRLTPTTIKHISLLHQLAKFHDRVSTLFKYMCKHQNQYNCSSLRRKIV